MIPHNGTSTNGRTHNRLIMSLTVFLLYGTLLLLSLIVIAIYTLRRRKLKKEKEKNNEEIANFGFEGILDKLPDDSSTYPLIAKDYDINEHRQAASLSPISQPKASTSTDGEELEAISFKDSEQLQSETVKKTLDQPTVTNEVDVSPGKTPGKSPSAASKLTGIEGTTISVPTVHAPAYPFSKGTHNQKDVLPSIIRAEVSKSVGLIHIDGQPEGTGFRVGDKYLVTCGHVIQNAIKYEPYTLESERLRIEFYRITYNQKEDPYLIFGFQPWIVYSDEDRDFVVLELCNDAGVPLPPALTCFADLSVSEIHLVGHPGGRQMKEDIVDPKWSPVHDNDLIPYIGGLACWSKEYFPDKKDYYSILLEPPKKIMFHTTFDKGSSGSPGVIIRNNKPCVVLMVRGGTPSCFYENIYPDKKVEDLEKVEYGYAMADIFRKMWESSQQNIKDLASEIFREWY